MGWRGRPSQEWAEEARQDRWEKRVGDTSLLSDLQLPRHLTEGAGQTKGEGRPVVPDRALEGGRERLGSLRVPGGLSPVSCLRGSRPRAHLDAIALAHAGAQGVQASRQVGRAAALAEVVGDAAGEAQRGESAAQTCGEGGAVRAEQGGVLGSPPGAPPAGSASGRAEAVPAASRGSQSELSVGGKQSEGPRGNGEGLEVGKQGLSVQEGG